MVLSARKVAPVTEALHADMHAPHVRHADFLTIENVCLFRLTKPLFQVKAQAFQGLTHR